MSVSDFPSRNSDPRLMLVNLARDYQEQIEDVFIIIQTKDGGCLKFATNHDVSFLSVCAILAQQLALRAAAGEIYS